MNTVTCIVIDDEPMALEKMEMYIGKVPFLRLVALCESPFEAMKVMAENDIDAIFVDINMPDLNGMDFINSLTVKPMVVFTTAYTEYAVRSYRLSAVDYLLKPFDFATFQQAANKLLQQKQSLPTTKKTVGQTDTLYVKVDYKYVSLRINDILYIKGMSEYIQIFPSDRKPMMVHTTMKQMLDQLPEHFIQVHRSYIVNMKRIKETERMRIIIGEDTVIPVSDNCKKAVNDYLTAHSIGKG